MFVILPVADEAALEQSERIIESQAFSHSDTLRRLLRYLTSKSLSGEADQLKEYTIGMDLFSKRTKYDPRQDPGVRIQVGRLRLKLAEYYASEGVQDPITITLPKGRFKLVFEPRVIAPESLHPNGFTPGIEKKADTPAPWRIVTGMLAVAVVLVLAWGSWSALRLNRVRQNQSVDPAWTPAIREFWGPVVDAKRPLLIVVRTPLFIGIRGLGVFRDRKSDAQWQQVAHSPTAGAVKRALGDRDIFPIHSYAGFGEAKSAALLGTLLARHTQNTHLVRSSDVSWQEISESSVVYLGSSQTVGELMHLLPVKPKLNLETDGLRIESDNGGKSSLIRDEFSGTSPSGYSFLGDDGIANTMIGVLPGPNGKGYVLAFLANRNVGILATVEYATDPAMLGRLLEKLRDPAGHIPKYFQVAIQFVFKNGVPVSSRYLVHREIQVDESSLTK